MRLPFCLIAALLLPCKALAAPPQVVTDDIGRFWATHDAVRAEPDVERQVALVQERYIDPGSPSLHALMQVRNYTAREYAGAMRAWPRFWTSVRPLTANAQQASATLERDLAAFRTLYPALRPATITYAVGVLRTGGTTLGDKVLIGAEMALGDERVDVSELPAKMRDRRRIFYDSRPGANNAQNNLHEYVHTQQRETTGSLAQYAVREGVAEYVAERLSGRRPALPLYSYGPGIASRRSTCASRPMRRRGIARMIELDYADAGAVRAFIEASGWLPDEAAGQRPALPDSSRR